MDRELFGCLRIFTHTFVHVPVNSKQCKYEYVCVRVRERVREREQEIRFN